MPKVPKTTSFLQYLKKDVSDEVDFLHADKHKGLLQIDILILMEIVRHSQNSQNSKFSMSLQYLKKKVRDEVDFWINFKVSWKFISALWPSTFPRKWYYYWYSWSWLDWVTVSLLENVRLCIPENNLVEQLYHTVEFIDLFQFCVSLIALYSYL